MKWLCLLLLGCGTQPYTQVGVQSSIPQPFTPSITMGTQRQFGPHFYLDANLQSPVIFVKDGVQTSISVGWQW